MKIIGLLVAIALALLVSTSAYALEDKDFSDFGGPGEIQQGGRQDQ